MSFKRYEMVCASIKNSEQPAHPRSLIRVFDWRSTNSQGSNFSSGGNLSLWLDCAGALNNLNHHCSHMPTCTLYWIQAYLFQVWCPRYPATFFKKNLMNVFQFPIIFLKFLFAGLFEAVSSKRYKMVCASIKNSDQPAHPRSLIRVFDGRSTGSQGSNFSSGGNIRL